TATAYPTRLRGAAVNHAPTPGSDAPRSYPPPLRFRAHRHDPTVDPRDRHSKHSKHRRMSLRPGRQHAGIADLVEGNLADCKEAPLTSDEPDACSWCDRRGVQFHQIRRVERLAQPGLSLTPRIEL